MGGAGGLGGGAPPVFGMVEVPGVGLGGTCGPEGAVRPAPPRAPAAAPAAAPPAAAANPPIPPPPAAAPLNPLITSNSSFNRSTPALCLVINESNEFDRSCVLASSLSFSIDCLILL